MGRQMNLILGLGLPIGLVKSFRRRSLTSEQTISRRAATSMARHVHAPHSPPADKQRPPPGFSAERTGRSIGGHVVLVVPTVTQRL